MVSFPDGITKLVVTFTVFTQSSNNLKKPVRLVRLLSNPLSTNEWLDIVVTYEPLPLQEHNLSTFEKGERARVSLYVNGELHATTEDYFGRFFQIIHFSKSLCRTSLHQNIVFGTTPISLIKPFSDHLLAGGLRWTIKPKLGQNLSPQKNFISFENNEDIEVPWLPLTDLHDRVVEASNAFTYCANATAMYLKDISIRIQEEVTFVHDNLENIKSYLRLTSLLGDVSLGALGLSTPAVDV